MPKAINRESLVDDFYNLKNNSDVAILNKLIDKYESYLALNRHDLEMEHVLIVVKAVKEDNLTNNYSACAKIAKPVLDWFCSTDDWSFLSICTLCVVIGYAEPYTCALELKQKAIDMVNAKFAKINTRIAIINVFHYNILYRLMRARYYDIEANDIEAIEFVQKTGCDSLAIAIGTSHGAYKFKGEPKLRYDILEKITFGLPEFPIVLHGASTVIPEFVEMCNRYGGNIPGAQRSSRRNA